MNVLMVGDIVGAPGRRAFAAVVAEMKKARLADFVVANAENAAGGKGLSAVVAEELLGAGADVLTLGDHAWDQRDMQNYIRGQKRVIRPANFSAGCPGSGWVTVDTGWGPVSVVNLVGRVFMRPYDCPFRAADAILQRCSPGARGMVLVDFHAEATSEKTAMGRYLDGRATCVAGTHTHVQTSDETILPGGTAYITDLGMTGPADSVLGCTFESVMPSLLNGMPSRFEVANGPALLGGALVRVDRGTGRAESIVRVRRAPGRPETADAAQGGSGGEPAEGRAAQGARGEAV